MESPLNQRPQIDIYLTEDLEEKGRKKGKGLDDRTGKLS
jgi:hypothetical protein